MKDLEVGLRVIRGPDWKWSDEDNGEGSLGTVIAVKPNKEQPRLVSVVWDFGHNSSFYRVGAENAFDLRVYDCGTVGVKHDISCDTCHGGLIGSRYSCVECNTIHLCDRCYHADQHDVSHSFYRVDIPNSPRVFLPPRRESQKIRIKGFSIGAKVMRGLNWEWECQDGGPGKTGRIISIEDGKVGKSYRSIAKVLWNIGKENIYRIGSYGKVDLKCISVEASVLCYKNHLPVLGQIPTNEFSSNMFKRGDRVIVDVNPTQLRHLQQDQNNKGGWSPQLLKFIGKTGIVHRVTEHKLIRVQFGDCDNRWTFDPRALTKVDPFYAGDFVYFIPDVVNAKNHLKDHGGWVESMARVMGDIGIVIKVYDDKDVRVAFNKNTFTLSPKCLQLVKSNAITDLNALEANYKEYLTSFLRNEAASVTVSSSSNNNNADQNLTSDISAPVAMEVKVHEVMREIVRGNPAAVDAYLDDPNNMVDFSVNGCKTLLHVASHQGYLEQVKRLLDKGACVYYPDETGDTPLHFATYGNQPHVLEALILAGGGINFNNKIGITPLHLAVFQNFPDCVKVLLKHGCNVNVQDNKKDTPLHDAIAKKYEEIQNLLLNHPDINFYLENDKGFNILNSAVLRGNKEVTEAILSKDLALATVAKSEDLFTPLHVASFNDHIEIVKLLLEKYQVDVNALDRRNRTPLMAAVCQGQSSVINYLVIQNVLLDVQDIDGNTCLHLLFLKRSFYKNPINRENAPQIYEEYLAVGGPSNENGILLAVFIFLVKHGALLTVENHNKQKPLDLIHEDTALLNEIIEHEKYYVTEVEDETDDLIVTGVSQILLDEKMLAKKLGSKFNVPKSVPVECSVCSELGVANVLLKPCNHAVACEDCSSRMKKCMICKTFIEARLTTDGRVVPGVERCEKSKIERVNYLESKISEIEEMNTCTICMERCRNTIFLCGHGTCEVCAGTLKFCHMCRKLIEQRINVFL